MDRSLVVSYVNPVNNEASNVLNELDWAMGAPIVVGLVLVLVGRQFFPLFVALIGFAFGYSIASETLSPEQTNEMLAVGGGGAILGAILVMAVRKIVSRFIGLVAGAYAGFMVVGAWGLTDGNLVWIVAGVSAAVGFLAGRFLFEWMLLVVSVVVGASLVVGAIEWNQENHAEFAFVGLIIAGLMIQSLMMSKKKSD